MMSEKKPKYRLKAGSDGELMAQQSKGAVVVTGPQLMRMTTKLLQRLDRTTAFLMSIQNMIEPDQDGMIHVRLAHENLQQMIDDNMTILEQFRKKEPGQ
jgi:predicted transcriptional regulator